MEAVILAAGRGSRLQAASACKPLTPLLGTTLLERNVRLAQEAGATRIVIITGYRHDDIVRWKAGLPVRLRERIEIVFNDRWDSTENGYSLAQAGAMLSGRFLLLMADHVYSAALLHSLVKGDPAEGAVLAVDRRLQRASIDPDDATKVRLEGRQITALGKDLAEAHAYDTGAFLCSEAVLPRLKAIREGADTRLSALMQTLADEGRLLACDVSHAYWQDVDTPTDLAAARAGLLAAMKQGKQADGPVSRYLNRPCSRWLTARLADTPITPNHISWLVLAVTLLAAGLTASAASWPVFILAGLLIQAASVLDGCDGEIARLRAQSSDYGGWLDAVLDRYGDAVLIAAMTWQAMQAGPPSVYWLGMAALAGSFLVSYSAHKSDRLLNERLRVGRDLRMLILALGIAVQQPTATLWLLAVFMNLTVAVRLYRMRHVM